MYCSKCGKENPEGARFCMECGADLSGYKVEISPKIEVAPKISVSAKAEGGVALKWKKKPIKYAEIKGIGKLPVFHDFVGHGNNESSPFLSPNAYFCPQCGNYGSLEKVIGDSLICKWSSDEHYHFNSGTYEVLKQKDEWVWIKYDMFECRACEKLSLLENDTSYKVLHISLLEYVYLDFNGIGKTPIYSWRAKGIDDHWFYYCSPASPTCPMCGADSKQVVSSLFSEKILEFGLFSTKNHIVYDLWKCQVCGFQFLTEKKYEEEKPTSCQVHVYTLCEVCENRKAEYTCSSCGKQICENCVVKKGLLSKKYLCPNCK